MLQEIEVTAEFFPKNVSDKGYLISNETDFCSYFEIEEEKFISDIRSAIASNMSVSSWDHIYGLLGFGTNIAKVTGGAPLIEASNILNQKQLNMLEMINDGKLIFVNKNGGYHEFKHETHKIIKQKDYEVNKRENIVFANKPTLINLENDPELESRTFAYFKQFDIEVSSICNLRTFKKNELVDILNEFSDKGGHGVYVYTTGNDVPQMIEYINAVAESKLDTLIIELNKVKTDEIDKAFKYADKIIKYFHQQ